MASGSDPSDTLQQNRLSEKKEWRYGAGIALIVATCSVLIVYVLTTGKRLQVTDGFPQGASIAQLGAYEDVATASREWVSIQERFGPILLQLEPMITQVTHEGRTYYRLRVGAFANLKDSRAFCERLFTSMQSCIPVIKP